MYNTLLKTNSTFRSIIIIVSITDYCLPKLLYSDTLYCIGLIRKINASVWFGNTSVGFTGLYSGSSTLLVSYLATQFSGCS